MHAGVRADDALRFADEAQAPPSDVAPWKVLVADDDEEMHRVTGLALADFSHFGRPIRLLSAYTGAEAVQMVAEQPDIALVLMDVVMETEHAGLNAVLAIRNQLRNRLTRIVIRTGQPGQAPEGLVVRHYDVNDYKEKTEVTARKLHTLVHSALSLYRELAAVTQCKEGLEQILGASAALQAQRSEESFAHRALQQLAVMLFADAPQMPVDMLLASQYPNRPSRVLAGTGFYAACAGRRIDEALSPEVWLEVDQALREAPRAFGARHFVAREAAPGGGELLIYIAGEGGNRNIEPSHIALFCRNLAAGFDGLRQQRELRQSQRSLAMLLATAIEQRMHSGSGHGQRVAATARVLGELAGLDAEALDALPVAVMLHDVGHLAIPEALLNKSVALTPDEQSLLETHTRWGQDLLSSQDSDMLQMAAVVAAQHHECWDGSGYPDRLAGAQIHLHARIAAVADALDELLYGPLPVPMEEAIEQVELQRGKRFDPQLVALLSRNIERFRRLNAVR